MRRRYLFLTGGLGNQIFQYLALLHYSDIHPGVIDTLNGKPRRNEFGNPDILELELCGSLSFHNRKMSTLTARSIGYMLRSKLYPTNLEKQKFWRYLTNLASSILVSIHFKKLIVVKVLGNLGDDLEFEVGNMNSYLVGYFQSTRWSEKIEASKRDILRLKHKNEIVKKYIEMSLLELPLVVHVRLGDYVSEGGFGVPGRSYYREAISSQTDTGKYKKIWLFSDQPTDALHHLPPGLKLGVRVIETECLSSAETLEIMRYGTGYVIANSTFSYWGARLSYSDNPIIIYPTPWFKDIEAPKNLIPKEWRGMHAHF